jgi:hypothetical protein
MKLYIFDHVKSHTNANPALAAALTKFVENWESLYMGDPVITIESDVEGLTNDLVKIEPGMRLGWGKRTGRDYPSHAVFHPAIPTDNVTAIILPVDITDPDFDPAIEDDATHGLVTFYAGEPAPKEADDPTASEEDIVFWNKHAIAYPSAGWDYVTWYDLGWKEDWD